MTRPVTVLLLSAGVLGALACAPLAARGAGIPADVVTSKAATGLVTDVRYHRRHRDARYRYRPQLLVRPYPRGFYDPGYAYHGNINGCAVDLGYGRYEPCNGAR